MTKKALREKCKLIRANLSASGEIEAISKGIVKKISSLDFFKKAKNILIFYPKKEEISLLGLLDVQEKNFYLPKTVGEKMVVCPYKKGDELKYSGFKVQEPVSEPLNDLSILDVVFVPALCADKYCHRLGYGRGYYDSFFKENVLVAKKVIVLPSAMFTEKIDTEVHDVPCDMVISEA